MLKIKPKSEVPPEDDAKQANSANVLREISKNLILKPPGATATSQRNQANLANKKRAYYYNYGTANPDQVREKNGILPFYF